MSFQEKIKQRISEKTVEESSNDNENLPEIIEGEKFEHSEYFGIDSMRSYPTCLDLHLADGNAKALPYSYITEINFNASEGIEIHTTSKKILVTGRNLKLLYNYLVAFRVKHIKANLGKDLAEEKTLFVKAITIEEL